jgi:murein DD-endopeptidase MepM/ murein hydrolase activator NlpD
MAKKFYTFIVAQPDHCKIRKISVPHSILYSLAFATFVGVITLVIFLVNFTRMAIKVTEFNRVRTELQNLKVENQNYQLSTAQLVEKISILEVLTQKLSDTADLVKSPGKNILSELGRAAYTMIDLEKAPDDPSFSTNESLQLLSDNINQLEVRVRRLETYFNHKYFRLTCTPSVWPVVGSVSDRFGQRESFSEAGEAAFHRGVDISASYGNPVWASADGTVVSAERFSNYGNIVVIDHGFGISTRYAHLSAFNVRFGQHLKRGQVIGYVGITGRATGPHLHYEVRVHGTPVNPLRYIPKPNVPKPS